MTDVVRPQKRPRSENADKKEEVSSPGIMSFVIDSLEAFDANHFAEAFDTFQAFHLPKCQKLHKKQHDKTVDWQDLGNIYQKLKAEDQKSWCIETTGPAEKPKSEDFLQPEITDHVAYCSFLVQKDKDSLSDLLKQLPLEAFSWNSWEYEPCLWIFFGRNPSKNDLQGRPEHTDSISHDGTWHYQLSGTKRWFLRPTGKLLEHLKEKLSSEEFSSWTESTRIQVDCHRGDVLVVNTRLWNHQTIIPSSQTEPSVSYARDFWVHGKVTQKEEENNDSCYMTNLDGLYATNDVEKGTIIFKETNMPDCELHRSATNPNCEVVELEDGTSAVVSCRPIAAGEFLCVPESSDEEEEEFEEDEDSFEEEEEDE
jgi:U3 small nucleolar RNA-associated protein 6